MAKVFYERDDVQKPGAILLTIGVSLTLDIRMVSQDHTEEGNRFPDPEFRADHVVQLEELLRDPTEAAASLLNQLAFAFDLPGPQ
jgi:hypothetical protein